MKKFALFLPVILLAAGCNSSVSSDSQLNNKITCNQKAKDFLAQQDSRNSAIGGLTTPSNFGYNQSLNTCLAAFTVYEKNSGTTYNIVDVLTEQRLYQFANFNDPSTEKLWQNNCPTDKTCLMTQEDYNKKVAELFN